MILGGTAALLVFRRMGRDAAAPAEGRNRPSAGRDGRKIRKKLR